MTETENTNVENEAVVTEPVENKSNTSSTDSSVADQLDTILQALKMLEESVQNIEGGGGATSSEEFTVLQTNVLEVRNEFTKLNKSIDETVVAGLQPLIAKLTEKVNRLEILTNNAGLDQQVILNITDQVEKTVASKISENAEVLYNQNSATTNLIKEDLSNLSDNIKECIQYLEKSFQNSSVGSLQNISDDLTVVSTNILKSNDNLKRSVIDMLSKMQDNMALANATKNTSGGFVDPSLNSNIELLKNGLYNINVNMSKQLNKVLSLVSEMELYRHLKDFSQLKSLPVMGELKENLSNSIYNTITKYLESLNNLSEGEEQYTQSQFTEDVFNEFVSLLGNISEKFVDEQKEEEQVKNDKLDYISSKIDSIERNADTSAKLLSEEVDGSIQNLSISLNEIKKNLSILQSGDENSDYTYCMQDVESDIAKIRIYINELIEDVKNTNYNQFSDELNNLTLLLDSINQNFNKFNEYNFSIVVPKMQEDLVSISTRVNNLLLSSDNNENLIKSSLEEFAIIQNDIKEQLSIVAGLDKFAGIEEQLNRVSSEIGEVNKYNDLINQSLVMLAEWVDNAGETLITMSEKLDFGFSDVSDIKSMVSAIEIPQPIDYTGQIQSLEDRISEQNDIIIQQQQYIEKLDEKLSTVLEFVAKNDSNAVVTRMNNIDEKLEKLNVSIGRLTAYVDED